jgi:hypothetical protein
MIDALYCVVVSDPDVVSDQRFPLLCEVPITATRGEGLLDAPLAPGQSGLTRRSATLIDHRRSLKQTAGPARLRRACSG